MSEKKILISASFAKSLIGFRFHLMKALQSKGYQVIVCAPFDKEVNISLQKNNIIFYPIRLNRTGFNLISDFLYIVQLNFLLKKEKPNMILSYTIKPVIYGSLVAKYLSIHKVYSMITGTGFVFSRSSFKSRLAETIAKILFKITLKFNDCIFFQNTDNLETFLQLNLISHKQKTVVINGSGIDVSSFIPTKFSDHITFLMIARLLVDKGIREYYEAAKKIKQNYPEVRFLLVGWLDKNPNAISQKELKAYIDSKIIIYLGKVDDVRPVISQSSVYVLPSYAEGTPRTVLEAMAMARPIITTNVPGCRQTVIHNQNGFLVPPKKIEALVQAMMKFIENPSLVIKMGKVSREIAVQKYDVQKVNALILEHIIL